MAFAFTTRSTSLCKSVSARQQGSLRACFATRPASSGPPALQKLSLHQAAPSFAPVRRISHTVCMAEQNAGQQLDKSTPDSTWKKLLSAQEFHVLREKGTEPPGSGKYDKFYEKGVYKCAGCGSVLYKSDTKFSSGCGWPAFYDNLPDTVERHEDNAFGMKRIEITCKNCGGHLGHVFQGEGFPTPTNERHCVNSASIKFEASQ